jgi:hypothetical protein
MPSHNPRVVAFAQLASSRSLLLMLLFAAAYLALASVIVAVRILSHVCCSNELSFLLGVVLAAGPLLSAMSFEFPIFPNNYFGT